MQPDGNLYHTYATSEKKLNSCHEPIDTCRAECYVVVVIMLVISYTFKFS